MRSKISAYQLIVMTSPVVPVKKGLHLKGAGARSSEVGDAASGSAMEEGGSFVLFAT